MAALPPEFGAAFVGVSSRLTHARTQVAQPAGRNASWLKCYNRTGDFTSVAGRGKFALPNAEGRALPPFSRSGVRRG